MPKTAKNSKGVPKTFILDKGLISLMDDMLRNTKTFGYHSYSEIVRRGIMLANWEGIPPYKSETSAGKKKAEKMEKIESINAMTKEEVSEFLSSPVYSTTDGNFVTFFAIPGSPGSVEPVLVEDVKKMMDPDNADGQARLNGHFSANDYSPVDIRLRLNYLSDSPGSRQTRKIMYNRYPIIFPGFENEHVVDVESTTVPSSPPLIEDKLTTSLEEKLNAKLQQISSQPSDRPDPGPGVQ